MTVTLPVHPFAGMALAVVRLERDHQGRRYVTVEHPHGGERSELRSIIGPNGAGKTSLFNLVTGKLRPQEGTIFLGAQNITAWSTHARINAGIGRSFQKTSIFANLSVFDNVRLAVQARTPHRYNILRHVRKFRDIGEQTMGVLQEVGLAEQGDALASTMSHGDQRRLEVALTLALRPRVMLLDEPTAGMSPGETQEMSRLVKQLSRQCTVILIEHDMDVVLSISDRISVMHQGRLIAEGTAAQIQALPVVQEAYLGTRPPARVLTSYRET